MIQNIFPKREIGKERSHWLSLASFICCYIRMHYVILYIFHTNNIKINLKETIMRIIILLCLLLVTSSVVADSPTVYQNSVNESLNTVYDRIYKSLEDIKFWVIFESNLGKNMAKNAKRWGENYNKNKLEGIRTMVICNPFYANQVSNIDPAMLGFCPLGVTLIHKEGTTTVLFGKPTAMAAGSEALELIQEIETKIVNAIETGLSE